MTTYIALFRGINVGGRNILPMKDLVDYLEGMGCKNVKTYIQSGNVVFQADPIATSKLAEELSSKIQESHGFKPNILMLKKAKMDRIIKNNPFSIKEGKALHFFFLDSQPQNPDLEMLNKLKSGTEKFELVENVFYLYAPDGIGRSKLASKVEKCMRVPGTARNWNTVIKLLSMTN